MTAPEYQFVKLLQNAASDGCGICLPVSTGEDIKFEYIPYSLLIAGTEESIVNFLKYKSIDIYSLIAGRGILIKSVLSTLMTEVDLKTLTCDINMIKPGASALLISFLKKLYQQNGTVDTISTDNLQLLLTDTTPYYYNPETVVLEYPNEIPLGYFRLYFNMNDVPEDIIKEPILLNNYEDESVIISGNIITAKRNCKVKFTGAPLLIGYVENDSSDNDWNVEDFKLYFNDVEVGINIANLATYNSYSGGFGWMINDLNLNTEIELLAGERIELKFSLYSNKIVDPINPNKSITLSLQFEEIIITRTDNTLAPFKGAWFRIEMVDENDDIIKVGGVDVINQIFQRDNISEDNKYGFSIIFDSSTLLNSLASCKVKFKLYEIEKTYAEDVEHLVCYTEVLEYMKDSVWLNQSTREYTGKPFYERVFPILDADNVIKLVNTGNFPINIILSDTETVVLPVNKLADIIFTKSTETWSVVIDDIDAYSLKVYLTTASGVVITELPSSVVTRGYININSYDLSTKLALGDCFRLKLVEIDELIYYTNVFVYVGCETDGTAQLKYKCNEPTFGFSFEEEMIVRLPIFLKNTQFPQEEKVYKMLNGKRKVLFASVDKEQEFETDYLPESWHEKMVVAISCDDITIDDIEMVKSDKYDIDTENVDYDECDNKLFKAKSKMQYNMTLRNSNCQS